MTYLILEVELEQSVLSGYHGGVDIGIALGSLVVAVSLAGATDTNSRALLGEEDMSMWE